MESQYTQSYINEICDRLSRNEKLITPGTFLASQLRGNAKRWAGRYEQSLRRSLIARGCVPCESAGKRTAFRPNGICTNA